MSRDEGWKKVKKMSWIHIRRSDQDQSIRYPIGVAEQVGKRCSGGFEGAIGDESKTAVVSKLGIRGSRVPCIKCQKVRYNGLGAIKVVSYSLAS